MMNMRDWKDRFGFLLSALFVSSLTVVTLPGCEEGTYEDAGEEIDEGIEETQDEIDDFGEETEDVFDDIDDEVDDLEDDLEEDPYDVDDPIDDGTP